MRFIAFAFLILVVSLIVLVIFLVLVGWYTHCEFVKLALSIAAITYGLRLFMLYIEAPKLAAFVLLAPAGGGLILFFCSPEWKGVRGESPLRVGPGDDYAKIDTLASDSLVTVIGANEGWTRVLVKGDPPLEGYVRSSSLSFLWSSPNVAGSAYLCLFGAALWPWTYFGERRVRRWRTRRVLRRDVLAELKRRYAENWDQRVHIAVPVAVGLVEEILSTAATKAQSEVEVRWLKSQLQSILREIGIENDLDHPDIFANKLTREIDYKPVEGGNDNERGR